LRIFGKNGEEIRSVEDWFAKAPPKQRARHWKDYRSAKELAKSWFRTANAAPPDEFLLFLRRLFPAGEVVLADGFPECVVALDDFGGEQRNTDLVVLGTAGPQKLAISVEAKADERSVTSLSANITIAGELFRGPISRRGLMLSVRPCSTRISIPGSGPCVTNFSTLQRERSSRRSNTVLTSPFSSFTNLLQIG